MRELLLTTGETTLVSEIDYDWLCGFTWWADYHNSSRQPYVKTQVNRKTIYMHRAITKCPDKYKVDHRDRDTLNNTRGNLRITTFHQNHANRGGYGLIPYKGVTLDGTRYRARITGQHIGFFATAEAAARAYDAEAFKLWGEFAYLNFREEMSDSVPFFT